jgi:hypothetical protein
MTNETVQKGNQYPNVVRILTPGSDDYNEYDTNWGSGSLLNVVSFSVLTTTPNEEFQLHLNQNTAAEPNFTVHWGDGTSNLIVNKYTPLLLHTYEVAAGRTITLTGSVPGISYVDDFLAQSNNKITSVDSLGSLAFETCRGMFYGCINSTYPALDNANVTGVTDFESMFHSFSGDPKVSNLDMATAVTIKGMFFNASNANPNCSQWVITELLDAEYCFDGSGLSTTNYNIFLNMCAGQAHKANVKVGARGINYTSAGSASHAALETNGWVFDDAGEI